MLQELIDYAGVEYRVGNGAEVTVCCPFCQERGYGEDSGFHMGVNTEKGLAHCFKCEWKMRGEVDIAKALAAAWDVRGFRVSGKRRRVVEKKSEDTEPVASGVPEEYEPLGDDPDPIAERVRAYLFGRGVSVVQIMRHRVGYAAVGEMAWRALFPVLDERGRVFGCVGRAVTAGQRPPYLNTPGIKLLWNGFRKNQTAVLVEGLMDALAVERAMWQVPGVTPVARLGSVLTKVQLDQLKEFKKVIVLPDWDRAGVRGAIKVCDMIAENGISVAVHVPECMNGSDPGDTEAEVLAARINGAVGWSKTNSLRMRVVLGREEVFAD